MSDQSSKTKTVLRIAAPLLAVAVLGAGISTGVISNADQQAQLKAQQSALLDLGQHQQNTVEQTDDLLKNSDPRVLQQMTPERTVSDQQLIDDFLKLVFTWSSDASYTEARESLQRKYKLPADGEFLKVFFPEAPRTSDAEGNLYSYIDASGLNSSLGQSTVIPTKVNGTMYSYMVFVVQTVTSSGGEGTGSNASVVLFDVGPDGIAAVSGYATTKAPKSAKGIEAPAES